jgi:hypothetical protein
MTALLISVLSSSLVAIFVSVYADHHRHRRDVALEITGWLDETFVRLNDLCLQIEGLPDEYTHLLPAEEYVRNTRILKSRLISGYMSNLIEMTYGEKQEHGLFTQLLDHMSHATSLLWASTATSRSGVPKQVDPLLKEIPEKRTALEKLLIQGSRFSWSTFPAFLLDTIRKTK